MGYNESLISPVRTSQFVFLPKQSHKLLQAIDMRAAHMSDLNMDFAEDHQFQNYGIGGHYGQHYDAFELKAVRKIFAVSQIFLVKNNFFCCHIFF